MRTRTWIALAIFLLAGLGAAGGGAVWYYFHVREQRIASFLAVAEEAYAQQSWGRAARHYRIWLTYHPDNLEVLRKYVDACLNIPEDRASALRDAAVGLYQLVTQDPTDRDALERLMKVHIKRRAWADLRYHADLLLRDPNRANDAFLRYNRALALERIGHVDEAVEAYRALIEEGTDQYDAYGNLARLLHARGLVDEAREVFKTGAGEGRPPEAEVLRQEAEYYLSTGDREKAQALIDQVLEQAPNNAAGLALAARLASRREEWERGLELARKALDAGLGEPGNTHLTVVLALERLGRAAEAVDYIAALDPVTKADEPDLYVSQAELLILLGRLDEAPQAIEAYRAVRPNQFSLPEYLEARILLAEGNAARAAAKLITVVEARPDFRQAQYYLAYAFLRSNDRQRARNTLEAYLRNNPDDERARAILRTEFQDEQRALPTAGEIAQLLEDTRTSTNALLTAARRQLTELLRTGQASPEQGKLVEQLLERVIAEAPGDAIAYQLLAEYYLFVKQPEAAAAVLDRAAGGGVDETELRLSRAGVALASGRPDEARARFDEFIRGPDVTVDAVINWANFFAVKGGTDEGLWVLATAASAFERDEAATLETERIALSIRYGALERAAQIVEELNARPDLTDESRAALYKQWEELVLRLTYRGADGDRDLAARLIAEFRAAQPESERPSLLQAQWLLLGSPPDWAGARAALEPILQRANASVDVLVLMGRIALSMGDRPAAQDFARRALSREPEHVNARLLQAELYFAAQRYADAQPLLDAILTTSPDDARALELLVETYRITGRISEAQERLNRLETLIGDSPEATRRLAVLRSRLQVARGQDLAAAEREIRQRYESEPDALSTATDLATVLIARGRPAEAETLLVEFAERHADNAEAWVTLARLFLGRRDAESDRKASTALTRALAIDRKYEPALYLFIELNLRQNRPLDALEFCDRYLELRPDDAAILYQQALILANLQGTSEQRAQFTEKALSVIERAIELDAGRNEYYYVRGVLYLARGDFAKARDDLQRYSRAVGRNTARLDLALAEAYFGLGERDLAVQFYEAAKRKTGEVDAADPAALERLRTRLGIEDGAQ